MNQPKKLRQTKFFEYNVDNYRLISKPRKLQKRSYIEEVSSFMRRTAHVILIPRLWCILYLGQN